MFQLTGFKPRCSASKDNCIEGDDNKHTKLSMNSLIIPKDTREVLQTTRDREPLKAERPNHNTVATTSKNYHGSGLFERHSDIFRSVSEETQPLGSPLAEKQELSFEEELPREVHPSSVKPSRQRNHLMNPTCTSSLVSRGSTFSPHEASAPSSMHLRESKEPFWWHSGEDEDDVFVSVPRFASGQSLPISRDTTVLFVENTQTETCTPTADNTPLCSSAATTTTTKTATRTLPINNHNNSNDHYSVFTSHHHHHHQYQHHSHFTSNPQSLSIKDHDSLHDSSSQGNGAISGTSESPCLIYPFVKRNSPEHSHQSVEIKKNAKEVTRHEYETMSSELLGVGDERTENMSFFACVSGEETGKWEASPEATTGADGSAEQNPLCITSISSLSVNETIKTAALEIAEPPNRTRKGSHSRAIPQDTSRPTSRSPLAPVTSALKFTDKAVEKNDSTVKSKDTLALPLQHHSKHLSSRERRQFNSPSCYPTTCMLPHASRPASTHGCARLVDPLPPSHSTGAAENGCLTNDGRTFRQCNDSVTRLASPERSPTGQVHLSGQSVPLADSHSSQCPLSMLSPHADDAELVETLLSQNNTIRTTDLEVEPLMISHVPSSSTLETIVLPRSAAIPIQKDRTTPLKSTPPDSCTSPEIRFADCSINAMPHWVHGHATCSEKTSTNLKIPVTASSTNEILDGKKKKKTKNKGVIDKPKGFKGVVNPFVTPNVGVETDSLKVNKPPSEMEKHVREMNSRDQQRPPFFTPTSPSKKLSTTTSRSSAMDTSQQSLGSPPLAHPSIMMNVSAHHMKEFNNGRSSPGLRIQIPQTSLSLMSSPLLQSPPTSVSPSGALQFGTTGTGSSGVAVSGGSPSHLLSPCHPSGRGTVLSFVEDCSSASQVANSQGSSTKRRATTGADSVEVERGSPGSFVSEGGEIGVALHRCVTPTTVSPSEKINLGVSQAAKSRDSGCGGSRRNSMLSNSVIPLSSPPCAFVSSSSLHGVPAVEAGEEEREDARPCCPLRDLDPDDPVKMTSLPTSVENTKDNNVEILPAISTFTKEEPDTHTITAPWTSSGVNEDRNADDGSAFGCTPPPHVSFLSSPAHASSAPVSTESVNFLVNDLSGLVGAADAVKSSITTMNYCSNSPHHQLEKTNATSPVGRNGDSTPSHRPSSNTSPSSALQYSFPVFTAHGCLNEEGKEGNSEGHNGSSNGGARQFVNPLLAHPHAYGRGRRSSATNAYYHTPFYASASSRSLNSYIPTMSQRLQTDSASLGLTPKFLRGNQSDTAIDTLGIQAASYSGSCHNTELRFTFTADFTPAAAREEDATWERRETRRYVEDEPNQYNHLVSYNSNPNPLGMEADSVDDELTDPIPVGKEDIAATGLQQNLSTFFASNCSKISARTFHFSEDEEDPPHTAGTENEEEYQLETERNKSSTGSKMKWERVAVGHDHRRRFSQVPIENITRSVSLPPGSKKELTVSPLLSPVHYTHHNHPQHQHRGHPPRPLRSGAPHCLHKMPSSLASSYASNKGWMPQDFSVENMVMNSANIPAHTFSLASVHYNQTNGTDPNHGGNHQKQNSVPLTPLLPSFIPCEGFDVLPSLHMTIIPSASSSYIIPETPIF